MFVALGIIGVLWVVGAVIVPDKNGPPGTLIFSTHKPPATAAQSTAPPPAH
ncbi:MAG TPA: hypothetical protein VL993_07160 [Stellaceae bacterium]|nr:hypothetical protein [Stellaceae bacterium]